MSAQTEPDSPVAAYDADAWFFAETFPTTEPEQQIDLAAINHWIGLLQQGDTPQVLDAGCGAGRMGRYLKDRGCDVTGIDVSPGMIEMAHRDHPDIDARVGSILELPHNDAAFDGAFYWYSIIHLADTRLPAAFAEARRVLRPGALALFAFQTGDGVRDVAEGSRHRGHDVTLLRYHRSPETVSTLLAEAGFDEILRMVRGSCGPEKDGQAVLGVRRRQENPH